MKWLFIYLFTLGGSKNPHKNKSEIKIQNDTESFVQNATQPLDGAISNTIESKFE